MGETVGGGLRRGSDRILAGVCSGVADYFHLDPTLVRVVFVILTLAPPGIGIILYVALWFLMEPSSASPGTSRNAAARVRQMGDELRREFSGWRQAQAQPGSPQAPSDPTGPSGGSAPAHRGRFGRPPSGNRPTSLWAGVILVLGGAYFLLANLGYLSGFRWDLFWPVILIALGLLVLFRRRPS